MIMEVRIQLDEKDMKSAQALSGISDPAALVVHVQREYVQFRSRQEILGMEGSDPKAKAPPRRKPPEFRNEEPRTDPNA
jgi:hypothetical protein